MNAHCKNCQNQRFKDSCKAVHQSPNLAVDSTTVKFRNLEIILIYPRF